MANKEVNFINSVKDKAIADMKKFGILASLTIAQAILESGWGTSKLAEDYKNLFGIKANTTWKGKTASLYTMEWNGTKYIRVMATWRVYPTWYESIADHTKLLTTSRYKKLVGITDYKKACKLIKECGYATSPTYTQKLISIIELWNLNQYDNEVIIERSLDNMNIKDLQRLLNKLGITDKNNKPLEIDGSEGELTISAKTKAKELLKYILK
jgi:flagellum-specific peptidoglycan hydrolase FlgJ